ncbi:MAG: fumarylacetoacetate hydrolase family protein [Proteobacteria bacterium]|nr:fumarylacetoacetate hydrolase family protein [Pseudomonadota bacterium]MDA1331255.1 fumarylacetoacetate hydrolase family protein [Pseudomonadota bacterium]
MQNQSKIALKAAQLLLEQHSQDAAFADLPIDIKPTTESQAYAIQSEFFKLRKSSLGDIVGYKVALTSEVMQNLVKFPTPFSGPLHGNLIYEDGVTLLTKNYGQLCIECEIAAVLKTDLPRRETPYCATDIADAIDTIAPALEIVDDRRADYDRISQEILTVIADNALNAGLVHGKMTDDWRQLDLATLKGTVRINGQLTGEGYGRDVLGHPFNALAWLSNKILDQGQTIKAGMTIITGSMIKTQFVQPGDQLTFTIPELGSVSIHVS